MENTSNQINRKHTFSLKKAIMWLSLFCLLILAFLVAGWFINSMNLVFLSERMDNQLDSKLKKLSADLKKEQNNYIEKKFQGFTEMISKLIKGEKETPVDPFILASLDSDILEITPENLIRNSSFEAGDSGKPRQWNYILDSTSGNTYQSKEGIRSGAFGLKFAGNLSSGNNGVQLGISQPVTKTVPGRTYTMSLYVKSVSIEEGTTLRFGFWDEYNNKYGPMKEIPLLSTQDWYRISTVQTTSGQITDGSNWYPVIEVRNHKSGSIYIDDVLLTEGSSLIAYSSSTAGNQNNNNSSLIGNGSVIVTLTGTMFPAESGVGSLGTTSNRFRDLYLLKATINENGDLNLQGDASVSGDLTVNDSATFNGNVTLGDSSTDILTFNGTSSFPNGINVGQNNEFTINSSGNITKINNVSYSFPASQGNAAEIIINDGSGNLTWGTFGAASVTADSLDFAQFKESMTVGADTSVNLYDGAANRDLRFYNSNSSSELFFLDGSTGNVGIGSTTPTALLSVEPSRKNSSDD